MGASGMPKIGVGGTAMENPWSIWTLYGFNMEIICYYYFFQMIFGLDMDTIRV